MNRWGAKGIFIQMMEGMAVAEAAVRKMVMIDAAYLMGVNDLGIETLYFRAKLTPVLGLMKGTPGSARSADAGRGCAA